MSRRRRKLLIAAASSALLAPSAGASVITLTSSKDNTLYQDNTGSLSNGAGEAFFAGKVGFGGGGALRRGLLAFDLSTVPTNAVLNSATVDLTCVKAPLTGNVSLKRALKNWGEAGSDGGPTGGSGEPAEMGDATWLHTFYNNQFWTNAGGDFSATVSATASLTADFTPKTFGPTAQLTADVQGWLSNPATNFGWAVIGDESTLSSAKRIASHEYADPSFRPHLNIDYSASTWKTGSGVWSAAGNWNFGVPNAAGAEANFTFASGPAISVTLDGARTAGTLNFASTSSYTLVGSALTLDRASGAVALNVNSGSHQIASSVNLNRSAEVNIAAGSTLSITGPLVIAAGVSIHKAGDGTLTANNLRADELVLDAGKVAIAPSGGNAGASRLTSLAISTGRFDLSDNKLITATPVGTWTGTNYTDVTEMIRTGRNGGSWNGDGIVTSQTAATTGSLTSIGVATAAQARLIAPAATTTFAGQTVTGSDTLVMYTYGGDANLDGKINVDDYGRIDSNIGLGTAGWYNGDFNYDGKVNVDDYGVIDSNIGIQGPPFSTADAATRSVAGLSAIPEPTSSAAIYLFAALGARRHRRR
jgi:hypothetical protein